MEYTEFTPEEILEGLSDKPHVLFEPILDELQMYEKNTEVLHIDWADLDISHDGTDLLFGGFPVHPYVAWRITKYLADVRKGKMQFWEEHADIWIQLLRATISKYGESSLIITNNQVVAINSFSYGLGTHLTFAEKALQALQNSARGTGYPMALGGFQVDPVWFHLKVLPVHQHRRTFHVGYQIDSNYLFRKGIPRASISHYAKDFRTDTEINLDEIWSIETPGLRKETVNLVASFERRFKKAKENGLVNTYRDTEKQLNKLDSNPALRPWKQGIIVKYQSQGVSTAKVRHSVAEFYEGSQLKFAFNLLQAIRDFSLERKLLTSRQLTRYLVEGIK